jgi:hypothetical protein
MSAVWIDADVPALVRLAELREALAVEPGKAALHAQVNALEDRLGLTPGARRRLQWEVEQPSREAEQMAPVRRLRVVDPRG